MDFEEIKEPRDLDGKMIKDVVFELIQEVKQLKNEYKSLNKPKKPTFPKDRIG